MFDRLVIVLVDALRHDFIYKHGYMPNVTRLIDQNKAIPFILNVKTPTVTLPRLKVIFLCFYI